MIAILLNLAVLRTICLRGVSRFLGFEMTCALNSQHFAEPLRVSAPIVTNAIKPTILQVAVLSSARDVIAYANMERCRCFGGVGRIGETAPALRALLERPCLYLRFFRMVPGSFLVSLSIAINNAM